MTHAPSALEEGDRARFNQIAENYCRKDLSPVASVARQHRLRQSLRPLELREDVSILEVGCGAGFSAKYLDGYYSRFLGIDYADNLVEYARHHNSGPTISFEACNVRDFRPSHQFDVILMVGVLHHFEEPETTLREIVGMLKPGGWVVANEPQSANLVVQAMRKARTRLDPSYSPDQLQFSAEQLETMYRNSGLADIVIQPQGLFSTPFAEVVVGPPFLFAPIAKLSVYVDQVLESTLGRALAPLSWNLVAAGRRGNA